MSLQTLSVQTQGSFGREALILFHAYPLTADMWREQMLLFSKTHYTLAPEFPGFNKGVLPPHPITFEYYVDSVLSFLKDSGIRQSTWCGLSMGGYLALRLYQRAPEMCRGLILANTKGTIDDNLTREKIWRSIKKLHHFRSDYLEQLWCQMVGIKARDSQKLKNHFLEMAEKNSEIALSTALVSLTTRMDSTQSLSLIDVPTLILAGEEDKIASLSDAQFLHKHIVNSQLEIIKKSGHLSNLEKPEEFNRIVSLFLASLHVSEYQSAIVN